MGLVRYMNLMICSDERNGRSVDKLTAIKAFCRVVETGGFTKAADSLNMPKTTVSKLC